MEIFNYDNRSLKILNILEENFSVQEKYLLDILRVGSKTIQNEIKDLNSMFKDNAYIKLKNLEYTLYIVNFEEYIKIKKKIYDIYKNFDSSKVRLVYIFKKLIEAKDSYLIDDLSFDMTVSRTTLNSDIKKLKSIIEDYDLSIVGKANKGIKIVGEEKDIRLFILANIYNYIYKENIFNTDDLLYIDELFEKYNIDLQVKVEFLKYLTISLDRTSNGFNLNFSKNSYDELLSFYVIDLIDDVAKYLFKKYNLVLLDDDKKFLTICFSTMRVPTTINKVSYSVKYDKEYQELVSKILLKVYNEYGLYVDISELMEEFIYHIYFLMQRQKYGVRYKNNMKEMIKEKYLMSYKIAQLGASVIADEYGYIISEDEICYLAIYFETFISKLNLTIDNFKILLITDSGPAYKELMLQQIKSLFKSDVTLDSKNSYDVGELDSYNLIISTVKNNYKTTSSIIYQNEILDLSYIKKEINFLKYIGKINAPVIRGMESILISSISEETFFKCDSSKTYKENVHDMISKLIKSNLIDKEFLDRIIEREKRSSMIFSKTIAFPHTVNINSDDKLVIAIGISKEGFVDKPDLKIIFLAAIPEKASNSILLVKTYDELIAIIKDEKILNELVNIENYRDFVSYFIKDTNLYR